MAAAVEAAVEVVWVAWAAAVVVVAGTEGKVAAAEIEMVAASKRMAAVGRVEEEEEVMEKAVGVAAAAVGAAPILPRSRPRKISSRGRSRHSPERWTVCSWAARAAQVARVAVPVVWSSALTQPED